MKPVRSWFKGLASKDRRRAERRQAATEVAYYWTGATPVAHRVRDISSTGVYLYTEDRWYPGTLVAMTLQRGEDSTPGLPRSIALQSKVIRSDTDGVGFEFVLPEGRARNHSGGGRNKMDADRTDKRALDKFLDWRCAAAGQALIEYILLLPLIFLLIVNAVNFGGFFYAWIAVANAARAGADYAIMGGSSVGAPEIPTAAQILSVVTQDISSLPNRSSLVVSICQNNNGTTTALMGTCTAMPSDPEPASYVLTTIDVTYTYKPFIPASFQFRNLGVYATIPPTTIHRRASMRLIL